MSFDVDIMIDRQIQMVTAKCEEKITNLKGLLQKQQEVLELKRRVFKAVAKKYPVSEDSHFSVVPVKSLSELNPVYNKYEDFDGYACLVSPSSSRNTYDVYYYQVEADVVQKTKR